MSSASRTAVDNRHVRTIGRDSVQEPPAARLRPSSSWPALSIENAAAKLDRVALYGTIEHWRETEATTTEMVLLLSVFYRGVEDHYSCCW